MNNQNREQRQEKLKTVYPKPKNTFQYLQLLNGIMRLTDTELNLLTKFVDIQLGLRKEGKEETNVFSAENKKQVAKELGYSNYTSLNNYVKAFLGKNVLEKYSSGYRVREFLIPWDEDKLVFDLSYSRGNSGAGNSSEEAE